MQVVYVIRKSVLKSFSFFNPLEIIKSGRALPVGTIREWKGKKYKKITPQKWVEVKEKSKHGDLIPEEKFNANNYKNKFTDPKCTNDAAGIKHVYSLLGKEGRATQAMVEKKLNEQSHRLKNGDTQIRNMHNIKYDENGKFVSGEWNEERKKLHLEIIKKILTPEKVNACKPKNGEKPKFIMLGGRG